MTSPVPLLVAGLALLFRRGIAERHHLTPFLCALGIFALCFAGLSISFFPLMVPPDITIRQAAAPRASQLFALVGASVLIPLILCYSASVIEFSAERCRKVPTITSWRGMFGQFAWFGGLWAAVVP